MPTGAKVVKEVIERQEPGIGQPKQKVAAGLVSQSLASEFVHGLKKSTGLLAPSYMNYLPLNSGLRFSLKAVTPSL